VPEAPRISYVVARLERVVRREIAQRVAPLTVSQYTALSVLRDRSGLSNAQLARRVFVTPQSMTEVVTVLEHQGLVRRTPDAEHRRILRIELTPHGREVLADCDAAVGEMEETMVAGLSGAERESLLAGLTSSVRALSARAHH
jgi:DNA-binding MarR family transcriptional regulator